MASGNAKPDTREALMLAARDLFLRQGYTATGIDQVCAAAGMTKGALFHYFENKEALGRAVLEAWVRDAGQAIASGAYRRLKDPLERALGYIDFTIEMSRMAPTGCIVGIFSQELAPSNEAIRAKCADALTHWRGDFEQILIEAKAKHAPNAAFDPRSVAQHSLAVLQGSLILARAYQRPEIVAEQLAHYRDYVVSLFEAGARAPATKQASGSAASPRRKARGSTKSGRV